MQTLLEPILVRFATQNGFHCRFDAKFLSFVQDQKSGLVTSTVLDNVTGDKLRIQSKYLAGADGGKSEVVRQLDLPLADIPGGGLATNVIVEADMTHIVQHSRGLLHGVVQPDRENPDFAWAGIARMLKPWHEWLFGFFPAPGILEIKATEEDWRRRVREFIGDDSVEVEIKSISHWRINECFANEFSRGNV